MYKFPFRICLFRILALVHRIRCTCLCHSGIFHPCLCLLCTSPRICLCIAGHIYHLCICHLCIDHLCICHLCICPCHNIQICHRNTGPRHHGYTDHVFSVFQEGSLQEH